MSGARSFPDLSGLTLVLGGMRSGKSRYAEGLLEAAPFAPVYIATARPLDAEMQARIAAHRARRGPRWRTVEEPVALPQAIAREAQDGRAVLVDCLTLWLTNLLVEARDPEAAFRALERALDAAACPVVLVSNEVGWGIVPAEALARRFIDLAGELHQRIAQRADRVILMVAGRALVLEGGEGPCTC